MIIVNITVMTKTHKTESTSIEDGLSDKVAIVTGGARGNGEAQAKVLANAGAEVYVVDILEGFRFRW